MFSAMQRYRPPRPLARTRFLLERLLLRGPQYRLLFIAAVLGLLSVLGGLLVLPSGGFSGWPEATWWAFLRLSDPGYLGDDTGTFVRIVSTFLTVAGYVVFLGSLVAIMTQWLNSTIARLERGTTPVSRAHHVVILGWTNRTIPIVRELLLSEERVRRFLHVRGARGLHIVILADEVNHTLRQELREQLGSLFEEGGITLRSGRICGWTTWTGWTSSGPASFSCPGRTCRHRGRARWPWTRGPSRPFSRWTRPHGPAAWTRPPRWWSRSTTAERSRWPGGATAAPASSWPPTRCSRASWRRTSGTRDSRTSTANFSPRATGTRSTCRKPETSRGPVPTS
jgi:hypothetical protein